MNAKLEKRLRKSTRKIAKDGYALAMFKIRRQRDWMTVVAILEGIGLVVSLGFLFL